MGVEKGDRVLVNVAPLIGSMRRGKQSVPCEVLEINGLQVHVRTEPPHRRFSLWVLSSWIEGKLAGNRDSFASVG